MAEWRSRIEAEPRIETALVALGVALDETRNNAREGLFDLLNRHRAATAFRTVLEQLGPVRMLLLLDWLTVPANPQRRALITALLTPGAADASPVTTRASRRLEMFDRDSDDGGGGFSPWAWFQLGQMASEVSQSHQETADLVRDRLAGRRPVTVEQSYIDQLIQQIQINDGETQKANNTVRAYMADVASWKHNAKQWENYATRLEQERDELKFAHELALDRKNKRQSDIDNYLEAFTNLNYFTTHLQRFAVNGLANEPEYEELNASYQCAWRGFINHQIITAIYTSDKALVEALEKKCPDRRAPFARTPTMMDSHQGAHHAIPSLFPPRPLGRAARRLFLRQRPGAQRLPHNNQAAHAVTDVRSLSRSAATIFLSMTIQGAQHALASQQQSPDGSPDRSILALGQSATPGPQQDDDTLALMSGYWFTERLMHKQVTETHDALWGPEGERKSQDEKDSISRNLRSFVQHWLLALSAVCECFVQLRLRSDSLAEAIDQNIGFLRAYRESYFAFAISEEGIFGPPWPHEDKLNAMEDLHAMLEDYFVTYFDSKYPTARD